MMEKKKRVWYRLYYLFLEQNSFIFWYRIILEPFISYEIIENK